MLDRLQAVFECFQRHDVKYVIIGGIAAVLHGVPRATFDLDILIEATPDNAQRLLDALLEAGLGTAALTTASEVLANEITIFRRGTYRRPRGCQAAGAGFSGGRVTGL